MAKPQRFQMTAFGLSTGSLSAVPVTLAVCVVGGGIAAGVIFGLQRSEAPISVVVTRLILLLLWLCIFAALLYANGGTLSSVGTGRRVALGVLLGMMSVFVVGLAAIIALAAYVNLGGRL